MATKTTRRKGSSFDLRAVMERVEAAGADGIPLNAPREKEGRVAAVLYTVSHKLTKKQRETGYRQIRRYLEETGATRTFAFGKRRIEAAVPLVRLNRKGREWLAEQRGEPVAGGTSSTKSVTGPDADTSRALTAQLRQQTELIESLRRDLRDAVRALARSGGNADNTDGRPAPSAPDADAITAAITDCLPAEGWIDIPQLRRRLRDDAGVTLGPGALADELRRLHGDGTVRLGAWQRSAREVPSPDHAILGPESVVLYYVSRGS